MVSTAASGAPAVDPGAGAATLADDYRVLTEGTGLLDRSERGKLTVTGEQAAEFLQGQVSNDIEALTPGSGCYAAFLTNKGKMLGDLRVLQTGEDLLLDCERVALQGLFNLIRRFSIGYGVELHKRTLERDLLSLIGPGSAQVVPGGEELAQVEHAHRSQEVDGVPVRAIRTEEGIDLLVASGEPSQRVRAALAGRGARAVGEHAAEALRVERGRPRYGIDLDEGVIPQEAALNERAVSFTKGCYVGQETVARLHYRGRPNRRLCGLALSAPAPTGARLGLGEREVGHVGSAVVHPRLGAIALALVRREAGEGAELTVGDRGVTAQILPLPFAVDRG